MADATHEAMLDARQEGGSYRRIEVITGQRRRRQWTAEEKARIVAESFEEGANISEVARRHWPAEGAGLVLRSFCGAEWSLRCADISFDHGDSPRSSPDRHSGSDRDGARARRREREAAGDDADAEGDDLRQAL
jgi:hypothetical protein